jgi:hypothetical protein
MTFWRSSHTFCKSITVDSKAAMRASNSPACGSVFRLAVPLKITNPRHEFLDGHSRVMASTSGTRISRTRKNYRTTSMRRGP